MSFPESVRTKVLLKCKRHCCLCGKYSSIYMELHHIKPKANGGLDTEDNCIPLCFNCHAKVRSYNPNHPKGLKYGENELKARRDEVYELVKNKIIDIYSVEDIIKAKKLMDTYGEELEYLIKKDPCGEITEFELIEFVDILSDELKTYKYNFENIGLDQEKCTLIDVLIG